MRIALQVGRYQFLVGVPQDPLERTLGRLLHRGVDLGGRGLLAEERREVDDAHRGDRHAEGHAGELALEFGDHEAHGPRGSGARGDDVEGRGPRVAEILGRRVDRLLRIGVGVDGGQQATVDAPGLMQHLGHRGQAVGRAGSIREDVVLLRVVHLVVDAQHDRQIFVLGRGRDHHLLHAAPLVGDRLRGIGEEASALHHHLDILRAPVDGTRVLLGKHLDLVTVDDQIVPLVADMPLEGTIVRVELEQVGIRLGVGEVVQGHDLDIAVEAVFLVDGPVGEATDATETVDADANGHGESPEAGLRRDVERTLPPRNDADGRPVEEARNIHRRATATQSAREKARF